MKSLISRLLRSRNALLLMACLLGGLIPVTFYFVAQAFQPYSGRALESLR